MSWGVPSSLHLQQLFVMSGLVMVSGLFRRLGLWDYFCLLVKYSQKDTSWPFLSVILVTSNIEVEWKCQGTLCDSYMQHSLEKRKSSTLMAPDVKSKKMNHEKKMSTHPLMQCVVSENTQTPIMGGILNRTSPLPLQIFHLHKS